MGGGAAPGGGGSAGTKPVDRLGGAKHAKKSKSTVNQVSVPRHQ